MVFCCLALSFFVVLASLYGFCFVMRWRSFCLRSCVAVHIVYSGWGMAQLSSSSLITNNYTASYVKREKKTQQNETTSPYRQGIAKSRGKKVNCRREKVIFPTIVRVLFELPLFSLTFVLLSFASIFILFNSIFFLFNSFWRERHQHITSVPFNCV